MPHEQHEQHNGARIAIQAMVTKELAYRLDQHRSSVWPVRSRATPIRDALEAYLPPLADNRKQAVRAWPSPA